MGKYERDWAEAAELAVCDGLNGNSANIHTQKVVDAIRNLQPDIALATWKGRQNYSHGGDVVLTLADGTTKLCELKFSLKSGAGTAKNLGAATFPKKIDPSIQGYKEYDYAQGYHNLRCQFLQDLIGRPIKTVKDYQTILRSFKSTDLTVLERIADITAPGKLEYAKYAAKQLNNHLSKVNQLVQTILPISDTRPAAENMLYCVTKNWTKPEQTTEFYDFKDMDTQVVKVEAVGQSIQMRNSNNKNVLTLSILWKNICQGGATPCFNVFFGNALR